MVKEIRMPLNIYVVWHEEFKEGYRYGRKIYDSFTRDINNPISRGIGIPVYLSSKYENINHKLNINLNNSDKVAITFQQMIQVVDENEDWEEYLKKLTDNCKDNKNYIVYPVAINKGALNLQVGEIDRKNFIRVFENDEQEKLEYLIFMLTHELCRFLYDINRVSEISDAISKEPVKLFLSHSKLDGVNLAKEIKNYIDKDTPLDDFFDTQDIGYGL